MLAACAAMLGLAVPSIVAYPPLCNWLVRSALNGSPLQVEIEGAEFGWWTPSDLRGIVVRDAQGDILARMTRLRCDRSLAQLLSGPDQLGRIEVRGPVIYVRRTSSGINWSDVWRALPRSSEASHRHAQLRILAGQIVVDDPASNRRKTLGPCVGHLQIAPHRFQGDLQVDRLPGQSTDPFAPKHIVKLRFSAYDQQPSWQIEAELDSDFAQITARGNAEHSRWTANWDLSRTYDYFGTLLPPELVALTGELHLEGTGQMTRQDAGQRVLEFTLDGRLTNVRAQHASGAICDESLVTLTAHGLRPMTGPWTTAELSLAASQDTLEVRHPAAESTGGSPSRSWDVQLTGSLARWQRRLAPWGAWPAGSTEGQMQLTAQVHRDGDAWRSDPLRIELDGVLHSADWGEVREPRIVVEGQVGYHPADGRWTVPNLSLQSTSIALRAVDLEWTGRLADVPTGRLAVRGDLDRMQGLMAALRPGLPPLAGQVSGSLVVSDSAPRDVAVDLTIEPLSVGRRPPSGIRATRTGSVPAQSTLSWNEPLVRLQLDGQWESGQRSPTVTRLAGLGSDWQLLCTGSWNPAQSQPGDRVAGKLHLRGPELQTRYAPELRNLLDLRGEVQVEFTVQPARLLASNDEAVPVVTDATDRESSEPAHVDLHWDDVRLLGMPLGGGPVRLELHSEAITISPARLPLADGHLLVSGQIDRSSSPVFRLASGPVLDGIHIDPALCHRWLKYVAPLMADITQADGTLSVRLDHLACPVKQPQEVHCQGVIKVQQATLGPGPMAQQLLAAAETVRTLLQQKSLPAAARPAAGPWVVMPEQNIGFAVQGRQVRHEQAVFQVGDIQLRTSGRVGFDQSLAIVAQVPVQDEWLDGTPWLQGLRGQSIAIPITGSLGTPRIDSRAVAELSRQVVQQAAVGAVQHELENQLRRLLERN